MVGVLANGSGPTVLLRCELDALPGGRRPAHRTRDVTVTDAGGHQVPVDHACGHDMHMAAMIAMASSWPTTAGVARDPISLFQPAEETGEGAQDMVDDGLFKRIPVPDVALAQHLLPGIAGTVRTRSGPFMSAADSVKVTLHGRGGHGSMPQNTIDPVVLAAMTIVRLQTVVSREVPPGDTAVLTVGSCHAGTRSNIIPDNAVLELNTRSYSKLSRQRMWTRSSGSSAPSARPAAPQGP